MNRKVPGLLVVGALVLSGCNGVSREDLLRQATDRGLAAFAVPGKISPNEMREGIAQAVGNIALQESISLKSAITPEITNDAMQRFKAAMVAIHGDAQLWHDADVASAADVTLAKAIGSGPGQLTEGPSGIYSDDSEAYFRMSFSGVSPGCSTASFHNPHGAGRADNPHKDTTVGGFAYKAGTCS